jgi:D-alanyl-D-alanine carboxypeptidase
MPNCTRRHFLASGVATLLGAHASAAESALNAAAENFATTQPFYGVVMLGKRGKPVYAKAFGMANIEGGLPLRTDTPFAVASISKWLTSVTVLRLVEAGKLDLDATIGALLPWYKADAANKVKLRHLLSNSSGIPNLFNAAIKADRSVLALELSTRQAIERFCMGELAFAPGSRFYYASTNWIIVMGIIEAATGMPFQQAMRAITLDPLKLAATRADQRYADDPATAIAYATINPPQRRTDVRPSYMEATGGYYSTADDLMRAAYGVFNQGFISPASLQALTHIEVASDSYALGGRVKNLLIDGKQHSFAWETGRTTGYRSVLGHRLDGEETVIILNNTDMSQKTMDEFAYSLLGATPSGLPA